MPVCDVVDPVGTRLCDYGSDGFSRVPVRAVLKNGNFFLC